MVNPGPDYLEPGYFPWENPPPDYLRYVFPPIDPHFYRAILRTKHALLRGGQDLYVQLWCFAAFEKYRHLPMKDLEEAFVRIKSDPEERDNLEKLSLEQENFRINAFAHQQNSPTDI